MNNFGEKVTFIWSVADLLRDAFKRSKYAQDQVARHCLPRGLMPYRQRCARTCLMSRFFGHPGRSRCSAIAAPIQNLY